MVMQFLTTEVVASDLNFSLDSVIYDLLDLGDPGPDFTYPS